MKINIRQTRYKNTTHTITPVLVIPPDTREARLNRLIHVCYREYTNHNPSTNYVTRYKRVKIVYINIYYFK